MTRSRASLPLPLPEGLRHVVAQIHGVNDLGASTWWEVVYYDTESKKWCAFFGSDTFDDGEKVTGWIYCEGLDQHESFHPIG